MKEAFPSSPASIFEQLLEAAPDAMIGVDEAGRIVFVNVQAEALFGYPRAALLRQEVEMLIPDRFGGGHSAHRASYSAEPMTRLMGSGQALFGRRKDGSEFQAEISLSSIETDEGTLATATVRDITDRAESEREKALQRELDRGRRLESVGQLAGGIAHDFNNLLAIIINYAEFVSNELDSASSVQEDVGEISRAAERAAGLTRQLLIFSRREVAKPEVLFLRDVVASLENLLRGALGERIALEVRFGTGRLPIEMDSGQLEQVLVNFAVNARDAMPDGGRLLVEVDSVELDDDYVYTHPDTKPGPHVRLTVSDTGVGMDAETIERVFEPFFTTKAEGTGLGLATAYGIITGAGGRIDVDSEPGIGTTMTVHLPASLVGPDGSSPTEGPGPRGSGELILVVEDEPDVKRMAERILTTNGYSVITTSDGQQALQLCRDRGREIDLLLTDVVMPGMLGTELVERVRLEFPQISVLFMSGYSHEVLVPEALSEQRDLAFIEKPFNAAGLLRTVRGCLAGSSS